MDESDKVSETLQRVAIEIPIGIYVVIGPFTVLIDAEDYERVIRKTWTVLSDRCCIQTNISINGKLRRTNLARFLVEKYDGGLVTRRSEDRFDFRKHALVICENMQTRQSLLSKGKAKSSSRFKGVSQCRRTGMWRASIRPGGASIYLGQFEREEDAALAYDRAALLHFGPLAFQNFRD